MTTPARFDVNEVQGDDWSLTCQFIDSRGYAIDYSTSEFTAAIRRGKTKNSPLAARFDVDMTDAATGTIVFTLSNAASSLLDSKYYHYDVQVTDYYGFKTTLIGGKITMTREITE